MKSLSWPQLFLFVMMVVAFRQGAAGDISESLESTGVMRQVYRSGNAPPPALAPDMNDGSGDYLVSQ